MEPLSWGRFILPFHIKLDRLQDVIEFVLVWIDSQLHDLPLGENATLSVLNRKKTGWFAVDTVLET